MGSVASKLLLLDQKYLSTWFINQYIRQCALLCPFYISRLFDDVSTSVNLQKAVSEIVHWRLNTSLDDMWRAVDNAECLIPVAMSQYSLTAHACVCWMNELTKIDKRFSVYFAAVALLHVARKLSRNDCSKEMMDVLSTVLGHNFNECSDVLSRCKTELITSELVELLQKSAVEHLTTYRQLMARDFGSVATIVTTDFEALYAYKRGDYQQCLQLSTQNVHKLLYARRMRSVCLYPDFIQLLDDDIVLLSALILMVNCECRGRPNDYCAVISQVTLSLYLMTQCQLKLHHSVTSLAQTLDYIKVAQIKHPRKCTLNQLTLKLIARKVEILQ